MPIEIRMPALSPTMTEGNLARWLKKEGDEVHSGDVIAEIETDKATMEYEAADDGRLGKIIVPEGAQGIKVNEPIALLLEEGEDRAASSRQTSSRRWRNPAPRSRSAPPPLLPPPCRPPCPPACRPSRRSRSSRSPATRPTPRNRTPRCAGSSPAASPNRSRRCRIS